MRPGKLLLYLFLLLLCLKGFAQQYMFRQYNVQDGLAHSQVSAILQDNKGYLWFTTYGGGISRFDGKNFINYTEKEGLPANITRPVIQDKKGNLWIGTMGAGICRFDGKTFTVLKDSSTKINEKIYTIVQSADGTIWFGADNGLYAYDGRHVTHFTGKDGLPEVPVMCVFQDSKGLVWVASWEKGVYVFDPSARSGSRLKGIRQFTQCDGLSFHTLMSVNEDSQGNIWLSSFKGATRAQRLPAGNFSFSHSFGKDIDSSLIYMVVDDHRDHLWFATTDRGLVKYDVKAGTWTKINSKNGMPGDVILCVYPDREGNIWLSNWGLGVSEMTGGEFIRYTTREGLGSDVINSVTGDRQGGLLINSSKGIFRYSGKTGLQPPDKQLENLTANSICMDQHGTLWIGLNKELIAYADGKIRKYTAADGIRAFPATTVTCDGEHLWIGSWTGGVSRLDLDDPANVKNYSTRNGLSSDYIYTVYKARNGKLYIGTWDGGLCVMDGERIDYYTRKDGLPSNNVISIAEDREGRIWLGTFGGGICRMDGKTFRCISSKDGLSDDAVVALLFDADDNLFVAASKGLNRLNTAEFNKSGRTLFRFYGKEEGFEGLECNRNAVYRDGRILWFGTKAGLMRYDPAQDRINTVVPPVYVTGLKLFFERTDWKKYADSLDAAGLPKHLSLSYRNNHLTFEFTGICTTNPGKLRYRYMLEGVDKDWSPPADKGDATYSGLSPGTYTFKVIACNNEGLYTQTPASFTFTIAPPFWQRIWFYVLCIALLISASLFYTQWKTKKLAKENKVLEGKVAERTARIEKQKDELQLAYREIENKNILVEQKNRDITDSINYAKRIQQAILPLEADIKKSLPQSFVLFKPRDIVSGDFYWFASMEGKSILAAVDCTGHGVPGAFMSMIGNSLLNEIVYEKKITSPDLILNYLDEGVRLALKQHQQETETQDGMDIALITLQQQGTETTLEYAGAHRPLYLFSNGTCREIAADKFPIGGMRGDEKRVFSNRQLILQKGDRFYMFSDGYVDQFGGENGKKFMTRRFRELLESLGNIGMQEQKLILDQTIEAWKGPVEQVDDILVIGVKVV